MNSRSKQICPLNLQVTILCFTLRIALELWVALVTWRERSWTRNITLPKRWYSFWRKSVPHKCSYLRCTCTVQIAGERLRVFRVMFNQELIFKQSAIQWSAQLVSKLTKKKVLMISIIDENSDLQPVHHTSILLWTSWQNKFLLQIW